MKKTILTILLVACSATIQAEEQLATPRPRIGGAVCLEGLVDCLPMTQSTPDGVVAGDMKMSAALASSAPGYPLSITTDNPKRNVINQAINECVVSVDNPGDMTVCMGGHGFLVTGYKF